MNNFMAISTWMCAVLSMTTATVYQDVLPLVTKNVTVLAVSHSPDENGVSVGVKMRPYTHGEEYVTATFVVKTTNEPPSLLYCDTHTSESIVHVFNASANNSRDFNSYTMKATANAAVVDAFLGGCLTCTVVVPPHNHRFRMCHGDVAIGGNTPMVRTYDISTLLAGLHTDSPHIVWLMLTAVILTLVILVATTAFMMRKTRKSD